MQHTAAALVQLRWPQHIQWGTCPGSGLCLLCPTTLSNMLAGEATWGLTSCHQQSTSGTIFDLFETGWASLRDRSWRHM